MFAEKRKKRIVEDWVRAYSRELFNFAQLRLASREEAEDALQTTFTRAFRYIDTFRAGTNERAWLYTILNNTIKDQQRKSARQPLMVPIDDPDQELGSVIADPDADPEAIVGKEMDLSLLSGAIANLPEEFAVPFLMREASDMKYSEIAETLGVPMGTVMSRLHRARKTLIEILSTSKPGPKPSEPNQESDRESESLIDGTSHPGGETHGL